MRGPHPRSAPRWTLERVKQGLVCATCVITLAITPTLGTNRPVASFHPGILCVVLGRRRKGCNSLLARNKNGGGAGDYSLEVDSPAMINAGSQIRSSRRRSALRFSLSLLSFSISISRNFALFHCVFAFLVLSLARFSTRKETSARLPIQSEIASSRNLPPLRVLSPKTVSFDVQDLDKSAGGLEVNRPVACKT